MKNCGGDCKFYAFVKNFAKRNIIKRNKSDSDFIDFKRNDVLTFKKQINFFD